MSSVDYYSSSMDKELQAEYDYVLLGTNLENSVFAGFGIKEE